MAEEEVFTTSGCCQNRVVQVPSLSESACCSDELINAAVESKGRAGKRHTDGDFARATFRLEHRRVARDLFLVETTAAAVGRCHERGFLHCRGQLRCLLLWRHPHMQALEVFWPRTWGHFLVVLVRLSTGPVGQIGGYHA